MKRPPLKPPRVPTGYLHLLEGLAGKIRPGSIVHVEVQHEPHCRLLAGQGECNCRPVVQSGERQ